MAIMKLLCSKFSYWGSLCGATSTSHSQGGTRSIGVPARSGAYSYIGGAGALLLLITCLFMPFPASASSTSSAIVPYVYSYSNNYYPTHSSAHTIHADARHSRTLAKQQQQIWKQVGPYIPGEAAFDQAGFSVDISADGKRVIVGAPKNDGTGGDLSGHARVFQFHDLKRKWLQVGNDIDGESKFSSAGMSVGMSSNGKRVILGAPFHDENGFNSGHARVYEEVGGKWFQIGPDIHGEAKDDLAGFSVDMDSHGKRIIVGAHGNNGNGENSGHARVFEQSNSTWVQVGNAINGDAAHDGFGESVGMSSDGKRVIIGSSSINGNGYLSGRVRVYQLEDILGEWVQVGANIDGEASGDLSGASVDISSNGTRIVIGARWNDGNGEWSGHARVFQENLLEWVQVGKDIDGEEAGDWSGRSVSMSADGSLVAIGAPFNKDNGKEAGHVRVYTEEKGAWVQKANDIDGEGTGDRFGSSVSISSNGKRVIGGAVYHGELDENPSGHVRIFELVDPPPPDIGASPSLSTKWLGIVSFIFLAVVELV